MSHCAYNDILGMPNHLLIKFAIRTSPLLSEVQIFWGKLVMQLAHCACISGVQVECSPINIFGSLRILIYCGRIVRPIQVMVIYYNFSFDPCRLEGWP